MTQDKTGRIIWHDLFTPNRPRAMAFYKRIAGWSYRTEHAADFAWGGGAKDFVLAMSEDDTGAGFVETARGMSDGWIPYVEVLDVDACATLAEKLGGTVLRQPFEVPGVGRNALLRDPHGAVIGISLSRHNFPAPQRQFGVDVYLSDATPSPHEFYAPLFDWTLVSAPSGSPDGDTFVGPSGGDVAVHLSNKLPNGERALWMPSLKVPDPAVAVRDAENQRVKLLDQISLRYAQQDCPVLRDPDGALICVLGV